MFIFSRPSNRQVLILTMGTLFSCSPGFKFDQIITSPISKRDFQDIVTVPGTLEASKTRNYGCPGIWSDVTITTLVPEGTCVEPGDTLAIMECRELENEYLAAANMLENARAGYHKSVAELELQFLLLEAQVKTIEASTAITRLDSVQLEFSTPSSREIIRLELEKAELDRGMTLRKLDFLKKINDSELQKMRLKIVQNENRVAQAKEKLDRLTLVSDIDGYVIYEKLWTSGKKVREGDVVWANMPILQIPDLSAFQVKLEVCETDYKRLAIDQSMHITVDAFPDIQLSGKIKYKAPVGKPVREKSQVKVFEVTASLDNDSLSIQPGLGVTCEVLVKSVPDTIVVPVISLFDEDSLKVVYIAGNEMFDRQVVTVSEYNNKEAIIGAGLEGNEVLALRKPPDSLINP